MTSECYHYDVHEPHSEIRLKMEHQQQHCCQLFNALKYEENHLEDGGLQDRLKHPGDAREEAHLLIDLSKFILYPHEHLL